MAFPPSRAVPDPSVRCIGGLGARVDFVGAVAGFAFCMSSKSSDRPVATGDFFALDVDFAVVDGSAASRIMNFFGIGSGSPGFGFGSSGGLGSGLLGDGMGTPADPLS